MLWFKIALRYLFSSKSHSVVNLISIVSVVAIVIPVAAMVFILSLNNGLIGMIDGLYVNFDPELKVVAKQESFFKVDSVKIASISDLEFVEVVSRTLEQNVLLKYNDTQYPATIKGVDSLYINVVGIKKLLTHGSYDFKLGELDQVVVGQGIAYNMGIRSFMHTPLEIYSLSRTLSPIIFNFIPQFTHKNAFPTAIYSLDMEMDGRYLFADIGFVEDLLNNNQEVSSLEINLKDGADYHSVKAAIMDILGDNIIVQSREDQRSDLYRMINMEKWIIAMMLFVIVFLSSLSLIGSLIMLNGEKRGQNMTLIYLGYQYYHIRRIFVGLGMIMSTVGVFLGLLIGVSLSLVQREWGVINMGNSTMLFDAYPIKIMSADIVIIATISIFVAFIISYFTIRRVKVV